MKYNGEFKHIDTADKAYILGLIYSDGNIVWNEGQSYQAKIKMNDKCVLDEIHKRFPFFCDPKPSNYNATYFTYCYSKELVSDLMTHGLIPSKSVKNIDKLGNPGVLQYPGDFIRGLFDGDGNVYVDPNNNKRISIYCNCERFLQYVAEIYDQHGIKYSFVRRKTRQMYVLKIGAQKAIMKWIELTSTTNSIYMPRKWDVINNFTWKDLRAIKSAATKSRSTLNRMNCKDAKEKSMPTCSQAS